MKILITGGAGYIGSILVEHLLKDVDRDSGICKHLITVVDNFRYNQTSLAHLCRYAALEIIRRDCRDVELMRPLINKCDTFIPLAALVGAPLCERDRQGAYSTNVEAIRSAVKRLSPNQRLIIPITNSGYGIGEVGKECTEDTPMKPISWYGRTKVMAEEAALERENSISLRLATVFGMSPRMRLDLLVNDFVYRAIRDKSIVLFESNFSRNFCHVRDAARAFIHSIENFDKMKSNVYNVGDTRANMTKRQLCEQVKNHTPDFEIFESLSGKDPDQRDYIVSNAKIERTGWYPEFSIDDGIKELIKGYQQLKHFQLGNV